MQLRVDAAWVAAIFLVAIRFGAVFAMTPVLGSVRLPAHLRIFLVLALSAALVTATRGRAPNVPMHAMDLALAAMGELAIGALLAFGLFAGFAAFLFGGRLLDMQIGVGVASLLDPATRNQSPLIGTGLNLLAVFVFFAVDGHHAIIRGLAYSLEKVPPGAFHGDFQIGAVVAMFGSMFIFGFALVAPVVLCLFMIDAGMAVNSRTMPQVNIFFLGISVKVAVGLVLLALSLQGMAPLMQRIFAAIFKYWEEVLS
jgi:flagellar biosynthesis protein FliR